MIFYSLTRKSRNSKTGPIPVSTTSAETCPAACPFKGSGCYADGYPLKGRWDEVTRGERGARSRNFVRTLRRFPPGNSGGITKRATCRAMASASTPPGLPLSSRQTMGSAVLRSPITARPGSVTPPQFVKLTPPGLPLTYRRTTSSTRTNSRRWTLARSRLYCPPLLTLAKPPPPRAARLHNVRQLIATLIAPIASYAPNNRAAL